MSLRDDSSTTVEDGDETKRQSSLINSNIACSTIHEEGSNDGSSRGASIDYVFDAQEVRPPKRTSFAPDPVNYRNAYEKNSAYVKNSHNSTPESLSFVSTIVNRFASTFTSTTLSDAQSVHRYGRTTIFSRGSQTLSIGSSDGEAESMRDIISTRENTCLVQSHYDALRRLVEHRFWNRACNIFILVMLFGSQIQVLWCPKSWDTAFDVVFTSAFVLLCCDIIFRSIVDPTYFSWSWGNEERQLRQEQRKCSWLRSIHKYTCCILSVGSFQFWFDAFGTVTFLYQIQYINPLLRSPLGYHAALSPLGVPITRVHSGFSDQIATPGSSVLLTIGRVARMARFIRTSVIVETAARLNCAKYISLRYWNRKLSCGFSEKKSTSRRSIYSLSRSPFVAPPAVHVDMNMPRNSSREQNLDTLHDSSSRPRSMRFFNNVASTIGLSKKTSEQYFQGSATENDIIRDCDGNQLKRPKKSSLYSKDSSSHVGAAMRELTGQRVAVGVIVALLLNVVFIYTQMEGTPIMTMIILHGQTGRPMPHADAALDIARSSVVPNLYSYQRFNESGLVISRIYEGKRTLQDLRIFEILNTSIHSDLADTIGLFDIRDAVYDDTMVDLFTTIFILIFWLIAVTAFAGPVFTLVVEPIERMVALLAMLMKDPLGYHNTPQYQRLIEEDNEIHEFSIWSKDSLKGMETSFLMSTILRIGSLMQVGFGAAGTEIIRNALERGRTKDILFLNKQGSTVSCIFLFCDIRSFTDATECLQEEVFVFTNKIAAVVHSITHSFGGSANKNIGDAFLVSWLLDERSSTSEEDEGDDQLYANNNQADKALLAVVKISIALYNDTYFFENMNEEAKIRLVAKFSKRPGPLVQMGFGLHAGKAVQGAIGSNRKLDATYISESVERAEFLESSTKKYGIPLLISEAFYSLLDPANKYRCRKVDQLLLLNEDDGVVFEDIRDKIEYGEKMNLYTFDMDIPSLWTNDDDVSDASTNEIHVSVSRSNRQSIRGSIFQSRRRSSSFGSDRLEESMEIRQSSKENISKEFNLPTGLCEYTERSWLAPEIKKIRRKYVRNGVFFPMFKSGLHAYYAKDWENAKSYFEMALAQIEDGPSRYYLKLMELHEGVPPRDFIGYGLE